MEDYVHLLDGHPGLRTSTTRLLGGRAADDNVMFDHQHIETVDDAGNAVQADVYDTRTCSFGHTLDQACRAVGICEIGGEVLCAAPSCSAACAVCGAVCCARHRKTRDLGDGRTVTYCSRCSWRHWLF